MKIGIVNKEHNKNQLGQLGQLQKFAVEKQTTFR